MFHLQSLSDKPCNFIVCCDMNARVSNIKDNVEDDYIVMYMHSLATIAQIISYSTVPKSMYGTNRSGSVLFHFGRQPGLRIANERVGWRVHILGVVRVLWIMSCFLRIY